MAPVKTQPTAPAAGQAQERRSQRGVALIFTLWGVAILALMATAFLRSMETEMVSVANISAAAEAEAVADGAVHTAIYALLNPERRNFRTDGTVFELTLPGGSASVRVQDEAGKIDLNGADAPRLAALLAALGEPPGRAAEIAANIVDYRDKDRTTDTGAAEMRRYPPGSAGPANRPLRSLAELGEIAGLDRALEARLRPHVTVGAFARSVDPMTATEPALAAQPGMGAAAARAFVEARGAGTPPPPEGIPWAASAGNRFTITAVGQSQGGALFGREALVVLDRDLPGAFRIAAWRRVDVLAAVPEDD